MTRSVLPLLQEKLPITGSFQNALIEKRIQSTALTGAVTSEGADFELSEAGFSTATTAFSVLADLSGGVEDKPDGERWSVE